MPEEGFEEFVEAEAGPGDGIELGGGVAESFGEGGGLEEVVGLETAGADEAGELEGETAGFPSGEGLAEEGGPCNW